MARIERIVLHIPHSSPVFPKGYGDWSQGIDEHIVRWTDWFTDWIFCQADLLGFMDGLPEGNRPPVLGVLFEPSRPAVGEHEPTPNRVKSSLLGLPR